MVSLNRKPASRTGRRPSPGRAGTTSNVRYNAPRTHEGGDAATEVSLEDRLARSVLSTMLWEDTFYEAGVSVAQRISDLAKQADPAYVADLAVRARTEYKLRHAPLLLIDAMTYGPAVGSSLIRETVPKVVNRVDELAELLAIYWRDGRRPIQNNLKKGLRDAFANFDAHQLKKYARRGGSVTLRDVIFLVSPKPRDEAEAALFKEIADGAARVEGTHERAMRDAGGGTFAKKTQEDKRQVWEDQLTREQIGYLALLKNLRNMVEANVDRDLIKAALLRRRGAHKVLPFRFLQAYEAAPQFEAELDRALIKSVEEAVLVDGNEETAVLVDVSDSMNWSKVSAGSVSMTRMKAAATLAVMVPGRRRVFTFSNQIKEVTEGAKGLRGVRAIVESQPHGGTQLGAAVDWVNDNVPYDRLIVLTDEQSSDYVDPPRNRGYMVNVSAEEHGVGYGPWVHVDGFSEHVLKYVAAYEAEHGLAELRRTPEAGDGW